MNGVTQVVGLWPNREQNEVADDALLDLRDFAVEDAEDESLVPRDWAIIFITAICGLAAIGWLVWLGMIYGPRWMAVTPAPDVIAAVSRQQCIDQPDHRER